MPLMHWVCHWLPWLPWAVVQAAALHIWQLHLQAHYRSGVQTHMLASLGQKLLGLEHPPCHSS